MQEKSAFIRAICTICVLFICCYVEPWSETKTLRPGDFALNSLWFRFVRVRGYCEFVNHTLTVSMANTLPSAGLTSNTSIRPGPSLAIEYSAKPSKLQAAGTLWFSCAWEKCCHKLLKCDWFIISHVMISYFYVYSDTTFLGGRNPGKTLKIWQLYVQFYTLGA